MSDISTATRQKLPTAVQKGFHLSALVLLAHNQPAVFGGPLCHQGRPVRERAISRVGRKRLKLSSEITLSRSTAFMKIKNV